MVCSVCLHAIEFKAMTVHEVDHFSNIDGNNLDALIAVLDPCPAAPVDLAVNMAPVFASQFGRGIGPWCYAT
jgi:hypothetical protein